ncbi:amidohydrolase [Kitasatospora sp. NA04385]|uniref:amidohydrolase n=1 Tax=Kitasatospora sp. NA04385 TaxID=2742135 RepID=UPI00159166F0|nr:amidohydrolase [Kitasatospora sp. NA04385]QKW18710.1 amidohydrolase [Kitasatospora sp. NA04385]
MSPDTIVLARTVRTLDDATPGATAVTAVAVTDGLITAVGSAADARDWRGPGTELIDLGDATLVPGLVDGHSHPALGLELSTGADLSAVRDLDGLRAALAGAARLDGWVLAWNLDHNAFGDHPVHRSVIEDVLGPDTPAFVRLYDGHSALATGPALRAAGVTGPRTFAQRATVVCDPDGTPTGHLIEHAAMDLVTAVMPSLPLARRRDALDDLLRRMAAGGLAGAHVMDAGGDILDLVRAIEDTRHLPLRLRIAPWCMPGTGAEGLRELASLQGESGRNWLVGGVKLFVDGTVEGGSAWLERPDCHGEGTAALWLDPAEYTDVVRQLDAYGVRTATHAIGDAGVRHVLDTVAALPGRGRGRHRIEHIETLGDEQARRFAELGVPASMQPTHSAYTRADHTDAWSTRLGIERAERAWICRTLRDTGATLALGSDWPIAHHDPRGVLAYARLRRHAGTDTAPVNPGQALTALMALEGYTTHAARAAGESEHTGRIAPGLRADLTAFALDPLTADPDAFATAAVPLTMSNGVVTNRGAA